MCIELEKMMLQGNLAEFAKHQLAERTILLNNDQFAAVRKSVHGVSFDVLSAISTIISLVYRTGVLDRNF